MPENLFNLGVAINVLWPEFFFSISVALLSGAEIVTNPLISGILQLFQFL